MDFERDLQSVWITDLTRSVVDGGQNEVGFAAKFIFKRADDEPGFGPSITIQSAVEVSPDEAFSAVEMRARAKAMAIVKRLAFETDSSLDAVVAAENAELSKTKEQRDAEFREQLTASIKSVGQSDD